MLHLRLRPNRYKMRRTGKIHKFYGNLPSTSLFTSGELQSSRVPLVQVDKYCITHSRWAAIRAMFFLLSCDMAGNLITRLSN